jgi:hypothetical protein
MHYIRRRQALGLRKNSSKPRPGKRLTTRPCAVPNCKNFARAGSKGWCNAHAHRARKYGDPLGAPARRSTLERLCSRVEQRDGSSCWFWTGSTNNKGYGRLGGNKGGSQLAHRAAYELIIGPIPAGLTIDHLCGVKICVNPAHLEPVTARENLERYWRKAIQA